MRQWGGAGGGEGLEREWVGGGEEGDSGDVGGRERGVAWCEKGNVGRGQRRGRTVPGEERHRIHVTDGGWANGAASCPLHRKGSACARSVANHAEADIVLSKSACPG